MAVLRIACVLCAAALLVGCGGSELPHSAGSPTLPRGLARTWATEADAIASAAAAQQSCRAQVLAGRLRDEVIRAGAKVPLRLRSPLLDGVNSLADRIVCTPPPRTVTSVQKPPPKPPKEHHEHGHHGHGGNQGEQG